MADYSDLIEQAGRQYNVDPKLLSLMLSTESGGDPSAVSKKGATGLLQLMPGTARDMGVTDPRDPAQNIMAGAKYLSQQLDKYRDPSVALAAYNAGPGAVDQHGGIPPYPETQNYVKKIMTAYQGGSQQQPRGQMPGLPPVGDDSQGASDPFAVLMAKTGKPQASAVPQQAAVDPFTALMSAKDKPREQSWKERSMEALDVGLHSRDIALGAVTHGVTGLGASIIGGWRGIATLLTGGSMDEAGRAVDEEVQNRTYQPTGKYSKMGAQAFDSGANPLNWPGIAGSYVGDKVNDVAGPAAGTAANVAVTFGLPYAAGKVAPKVIPAMRRPIVTAQDAQEAAHGAPVIDDRARPGADSTHTQASGHSPAEVRDPQAAPTQQQPTSTTAPAEATSQAVEPQQGAKLSPAERQDVLSQVGITSARRSALAGDKASAATDWNTAKLDSPAGRQLRAQFESEKTALETSAEELARSTGGTLGTDQSAVFARGHTILAPLDALKQWFDSRTGALYRIADERAQGVPTELDRFRTVLGDDSEMTNSDRVQLRSAISAYAKKLGIMGEDGKVFSNGQQAETMRKYLSEQWSPQNGKWVAKLKDALDEDVAASAGEDVYGEARKLWQVRKQTLDNPNGIAKIMDASGPEGINRAVPIEKVADQLTTMPVEQFRHVVKTLKNMPDDLQAQGQAALAELKAQFANKFAEKGASQQGQWNSKGAGEYLKANAERMAEVFSPEEMQRFDTLRKAGEILRVEQGYPGSSVQEHNLLRSGVMKAVKYGSTAAGTMMGGSVGSFLGQAAGEAVANKMGDAASLKAAQKRLVPIKSMLDPSGRQ
jgi:hypothetical protein